MLGTTTIITIYMVAVTRGVSSQDLIPIAFSHQRTVLIDRSVASALPTMARIPFFSDKVVLAAMRLVGDVAKS